MSYISELQIDNGAIIPIGSSLYGICTSGVNAYTKEVSLDNFNALVRGVTVHVKFTNGNSAPLVNPNDSSQYLKLKVGSTSAQQILNPGGNINWSSGAVISFTLDGDTEPYNWIVNDSDSGAEITIEQHYNSNSSNAISGSGVSEALGDLNGKGVITSIVESGTGANKTSTDLPTTNAVTSYIDSKTAGITGAMHFVGSTSTALTDGATTSTLTPKTSGSLSKTTNFIAGDVVLYNDAEYVWNGATWEILGDESSYALKTNTEDVIKTATFTPDVPGSLTTKDTSIPNVTSAGSAATFSVASGVLSITTGSAPTLGTAITIKEVDSWTAGSAASLNTTTQTVVVPSSNS